MNPPRLDNIPAELKPHRQWVNWRLEIRDGKPTKVPYSPNSRKAAVSKPETWADFAAVANAAPRFSGIGFVLTAADDFVGIDLDKCLNPETGELEDFAQKIVAAFPTYCEISPSGRGLRLFAKGKLPPGGRRKGRVEIYEEGRYLTVTGQQFGAVAEIRDCTPELAALHAELFPPRPPAKSPRAPAVPGDPSDAELIEKATRARNGRDFARLWAGDLSGHDGDHSAADLALCNLLAFWTGNDPARMDRLFRQSALVRDKWDEKRGESGTYGEITLRKALESARDTYSPRSVNPLPTGKKSPIQPIQPIQDPQHSEKEAENSSETCIGSGFEPDTTDTNPVTAGALKPYFFMDKADGTRLSVGPEQAENHPQVAPGLYYVPVVQEKNGRESTMKHGAPVWISIPFDLLASTDDGQGHGHGLAMKFQAMHGHSHTWTLPRALLVCEGRELFQKLYDMGFHMSLTDGAFQRLREYLNRARTEVRDLPQALSVSRTGWARGQRFVLPDTIFGRNGGEVFYQSDDPRPSPYTLAGTAEGWREGVAQPAAAFELPVFVLSCAFAGPLLEPLRIESGGFHLLGLSSTGKTTAEQWALSVWGAPKELIQTWNGTRVGVELVTAAFSDTLLVLDEIGQADPRAVGEIVYLICNESGRTRGNVRLTHRANLRWRTLLLSSGEKSLAQIMAGPGGVPPAAGQETRLAHLPVDTGDECGIFTGLTDPQDRKRLLTSISAAARQHHGHAARQFLARLTGLDGLPEPEEAAALVKRTAAAMAGPDATNEIDRVALRFALVGYAGELAAKWGITGWKNGCAQVAAQAMFRRWKAQWGSGSRDETLFLLRCDEWLTEHQTSSFAEVDPITHDVDSGTARRMSSLRPFYGYTHLNEGVRVYYLNAAGWRALTHQSGRGVALSALNRVGRLIGGGEGNGGKSIRINGELSRFYVVQAERNPEPATDD